MSKTEIATTASGACLCGAVRYSVRGELRDVVNCHCSQCRRSHGHHAAYSSVALADLQIESDGGSDGDALRWYTAPDRIARRGFCQYCGASLFWAPLGEPRVAVAAGSLDQPTGLTTVRHIFTADMGDYYEISDSLEQLPRGHAG